MFVSSKKYGKLFYMVNLERTNMTERNPYLRTYNHKNKRRGTLKKQCRRMLRRHKIMIRRAVFLVGSLILTAFLILFLDRVLFGPMPSF